MQKKLGANQKSRLEEFFSNPTVGIVGSIASILSLGLAIYFYAVPNTSRELAYLVNPAKAIVVKSDQLSRLSVTLDGNPITTDVAAAQVAIWNNGNEPIRPENILQPIKLVASGHTRIFEATVRKNSREHVQIKLDDSKIDQGELGISWNILEQNDGAILQIVYAGSPNTDITISGTIEGRKEVRNAWNELANRQSALDERFKGQANKFMAYAYIAMGILMQVVNFWLTRKAKQSGIKSPGFRRAIVMSGGMMVILGLLALKFLVQDSPPFGF